MELHRNAGENDLCYGLLSETGHKTISARVWGEVLLSSMIDEKLIMLKALRTTTSL